MPTRPSIILSLIISLLALAIGGIPAHAQPLPSLQVSADHHRLETSDGQTFFWLGDTAWEMIHRLSREDVEHYLDVRKAQGFNLVQTVVISDQGGNRNPNAYGHLPLVDNDPTRPAIVEGPANDYWDHVDFIVDAANRRGMYVGLLPTWGRYWQDQTPEPPLFNRKNAEIYGRAIGARYKDKALVWIVGGDRHFENEEEQEIVRAMARGLRDGDGGTHLITFHPRGEHSSSEYFHGESWLDFNMRQNGHVAPYRFFGNTRLDFERLPTKPVIDGEPLYEGHPVYRPDGSGYSLAIDVRRALYWDLFAGAFGHTYGHNAVWQMWSEGLEPINGPEFSWRRALDTPGAKQMQFGRRLMESRPAQGRVPDNDIIASFDVKADEPAVERYQFAATRASDGSYAMIYAPVARTCRIKLEKLSGSEVVAWWYNPRTGEATRIDQFPATGEREFTPPPSKDELDWVLVLDDASRAFPAPGTQIQISR